MAKSYTIKRNGRIDRVSAERGSISGVGVGPRGETGTRKRDGNFEEATLESVELGFANQRAKEYVEQLNREAAEAQAKREETQRVQEENQRLQEFSAGDVVESLRQARGINNPLFNQRPPTAGEVIAAARSRNLNLSQLDSREVESTTVYEIPAFQVTKQNNNSSQQISAPPPSMYEQEQNIPRGQSAQETSQQFLKDDYNLTGNGTIRRFDVDNSIPNIHGNDIFGRKSVAFARRSAEAGVKVVTTVQDFAASGLSGVFAVGLTFLPGSLTRFAVDPDGQYKDLTNQELKALVRSTPEYQSGAITVGLVGLGSGAPTVAKYVIPPVTTYFAGKSGKDLLKAPSIETGTNFVLNLVFAREGARPLAREVYVRAGSKYLPPEKIIDADVLAGTETLPKTSSVPEAMQQFKAARNDKGQVVVTSAADQPLPSLKVQKPASSPGGKGIEDLGLYVTPETRSSAYFLRAGYDGRVSLLPQDTINPTISRIALLDVQRQPKSILLTPDYIGTNQFKTSQAGTGVAFISKRSEAYFDPKIRATLSKNVRGGTNEIEAIIPQNTQFTQNTKTILGRFKGFDYYTKFKGEVVPIREYQALVTKTTRSSTPKYDARVRNTKELAKEARELSRFLERPTRSVTPVPAYSGRGSSARSTASAASSSPLRSVRSQIESTLKGSREKARSTLDRSYQKIRFGKSYLNFGGSSRFSSGGSSRFTGGSSSYRTSSGGSSTTTVPIEDVPPPTVPFGRTRRKEKKPQLSLSKVFRETKYMPSVVAQELSLKASRRFKERVDLTGLELRGE